MRVALIVAVLCFCCCGPKAFAQNAFIKNNLRFSSVLDTGADAPSPAEGIANFINRLDAWIQKHLW